MKTKQNYHNKHIEEMKNLVDQLAIDTKKFVAKANEKRTKQNIYVCSNCKNDVPAPKWIVTGGLCGFCYEALKNVIGNFGYKGRNSCG